VQRKSKRPQLTKTDRAFWVALSGLWPDLAQRPHPREARDRDRLASQGLSALLDLEEPAPRRPSPDRSRAPDSHPSNGPREPDVGRASHSRRVAQARLRARRSHGLADHAASAKTVFALLACVSAEPHQGPRFHRLLCRAHRDFSHPVCVSRARAPRVRPRDGRASNWSTPSLTTRRRNSSSGTETRLMARTSFVECVQWESSRCSPGPGPHGRMRW
jgi:hypothetical protein